MKWIGQFLALLETSVKKKKRIKNKKSIKWQYKSFDYSWCYELTLAHRNRVMGH